MSTGPFDRHVPGSARMVGAVLVGGRSRRMGRDKATVEVGGRPLAAVAVAALWGAGAREVVAVGGPAATAAVLGLRHVGDDHPGEGPLGAILTALRDRSVQGAEVLVALSCDLPFADHRAVELVVAALLDAPAALAAVPTVGGRPEPLHAAWRPGALGPVEAAFAAGERAPSRVLDALGAVPVSGCRPATLAGVNTPAQLRDVVGGASGHTGDMTHSAPLPEIDIAELASRRGEAWILDVRQPDEYEAGHVPGAVLIPLDQLGERRGEVPTDTDVLVICKSGGRSAAAVEALNRAGHRTANVAGGTMAWIEAGHPVVTGSEPG